MEKKKLSTKQKWLNFLKKGLPIIVGLILAMVTTFGVTMAYFGQSSGPLSTDITLKTGVKIGSTSSIAGSTDKVVPSQPVTISATAMVEPADNKTTTITDAILRAKVRTTTEEDINLQISTTAVTVGTKTGYWVEHTDGYFYLCAETKNATVGNTKLLVFNPGTAGVSVPMSGSFVVPNTITNDMGGEPLNVIATFEVAQGELYTAGSTTRIPDASMTIANTTVQEVFGSLVTTYEVGDIITFGEYPQTLKAADIPDPTQVVDATGFNGQPIYLGSDGNRYVKQTVKYDEWALDYYITRCGMDKSLDGRTMTNGQSYFFKIEPIEWKILSIENGVAQIWCTKVLKGQVFQTNYAKYSNEYYITDGTITNGDSALDETHLIKDNGQLVYANNYEHSELNKFLTGEFYNTAFSSGEKPSIVTTLVDNSASTTNNPTDNPYVCDSFEAKVYALSYADVTNPEYGFVADADTPDVNRLQAVTDYGVATGAVKCNEAFLLDMMELSSKSELVAMVVQMGFTTEESVEVVDKMCTSGGFWLRSPGEISSDGSYINGGIFFDIHGAGPTGFVNFVGLGALPALQIAI